MDHPISAPALSTSASHIFDDDIQINHIETQKLSDEQISIRYEIDQTIKEIKEARFNRIALQFPDEMLPHAPRVLELMNRRLQDHGPLKEPALTTETGHISASLERDDYDRPEARLFILGDTSYGACCIDEVAAEHMDADTVIHFGRACLSPTARLPAIYTFTKQPLNDIASTIQSFKEQFREKERKVILMADAPYQYVSPKIASILEEDGYLNVFQTVVQRDPQSPLPNRSIPEEVRNGSSKLEDWHVFHLGRPAEALLLTLSSRVGSIYVCPVDASGEVDRRETSEYSASRLLNRRYALVTAVSSASIIGILINTLSVKNYLHIVDHVKKSILNAGKKSYTFVVGKVNTAKVSNFSEIDAWVVIGCWESSLITSKDFYKPLITPFELELALQTDEERMWTGKWTSNYQSVLDVGSSNGVSDQSAQQHGLGMEKGEGESDTEGDSLPPAFDLRTGRYVSSSRPLQTSAQNTSGRKSENAIVKREAGQLVSIGGEFSPGADYLNNQRQWRGLGSDFNQTTSNEEAATIQEGHEGIASGYKYGQTDKKM